MTDGIVLYAPEEAAKLLNKSLSWLAKTRMTGGGPPFIKLGSNVRYARGDLENFILANRCRSTSEFDTSSYKRNSRASVARRLASNPMLPDATSK